MDDISSEIINGLVIPIVVAQTFLFVYAYFFIVRNRLGEAFKYYTIFNVVFIVFMIFRPVQLAVEDPLKAWVIYARVSALYSLAAPSLLIAMIAQAGLNYTRKIVVGAYSVGALLSLAYVVLSDLKKVHVIFDAETISLAEPLLNTFSFYHIQLVVTILLLVLPYVVLSVMELRDQKRTRLMICYSGILVYGIAMTYSSAVYEFTVGYSMSVVLAICWCCTVYFDIRDMKGKVFLLKEELQHCIVSGSGAPKVQTLLNKLEETSSDDLALYKIRLHEILSMLSDTTITAGADSASVEERSHELMAQIDKSDDPQKLNELVYKEAVEVSEMVANQPKKQHEDLVERAKEYITKNFNKNIGVAEVAEHLYVSGGHLMNIFKKCEGKTFNQYMTTVRIERAKELLMKKSVTDTAYDVGFSSPGYFSTVFKKQTGMTPVQYQEQRSC